MNRPNLISVFPYPEVPEGYTHGKNFNYVDGMRVPFGPLDEKHRNCKDEKCQNFLCERKELARNRKIRYDIKDRTDRSRR